MSVNRLAYSNTGLHLTEKFEGCRTSAYQDLHSIWTIGYGHTGPGVHRGQTITLDQAETLLLRDVSRAAACVNENILIPIRQDEFDALVDFVFNCGVAAFRGSTLLLELNAGNFAAAAEQFLMWDRCDGSIVAGLLRRRLAEKALFLGLEPAAPKIAVPDVAKPRSA